MQKRESVKKRKMASKVESIFRRCRNVGSMLSSCRDSTCTDGWDRFLKLLLGHLKSFPKPDLWAFRELGFYARDRSSRDHTT